MFLRHVLEPSLTESQFLTEVFEGFTLGKSFGFNQRYIHSLTKVYHVDGQGKSQGVVYCEMASRENTEADLLDLELRRMVYDGQGTYAFECGGLTGDIEKLST